MATEIAQLKAELTDLNVKCQLARDNEVRFALQRGRLEAERTNLLVKMIEALAPEAVTVAAPAAALSAAPYTITLSSPGLTCPKGREVPPVIPVTLRQSSARLTGKRKRVIKPQNLPTTEDMIFAVLDGAGWQRPNQITAAIRARYWKDAPRNAAPPVAWRLGRAGRLERGDDGYRLPIPKSNGQFGAQ